MSKKRKTIIHAFITVFLLIIVVTVFLFSDFNPAVAPTITPTDIIDPSQNPTATLEPTLIPTNTPTPLPTPTPTPIEINGIVLLSDMHDNFIYDIKYATEDNFTGQQVYPVAVAALNKETAKILIEAAKIFEEDGYRVKIYDAYRPINVQQIFWDIMPNSRFIAPAPDPNNPNPYPDHCNGMSVDLTLVDESGNEIEMPSEFDNFTERASVDYPYMSDEARRNVDYLLSVMESVGFENYSVEWWHFDDAVNDPIPFQDVPLENFLIG